jgi:hypothetical protein
MSCCGSTCKPASVSADCKPSPTVEKSAVGLEKPSGEAHNTDTCHKDACHREKKLDAKSAVGGAYTSPKPPKSSDTKKRKNRDDGQENEIDGDLGLDIFEFLTPSDLRLTPKALIETHISHFRCNVNGESLWGNAEKKLLDKFLSQAVPGTIGAIPHSQDIAAKNTQR